MVYTRNLNLELLKLPDCDALLENGKCNCLDVPACLGASCPSYHKKDSPEKVFARLRSLDEEKQEYISQKYYGGKRPWAQSEVKPQG